METEYCNIIVRMGSTLRGLKEKVLFNKLLEISAILCSFLN